MLRGCKDAATVTSRVAGHAITPMALTRCRRFWQCLRSPQMSHGAGQVSVPDKVVVLLLQSWYSSYGR